MTLVNAIAPHIFTNITNNFPIIPKDQFPPYPTYGWMDKFLGKADKKELHKFMQTLLNTQKDIKHHNYLFSLLDSDHSKYRLIHVLTYKIMGPKYIEFFPDFLKRGNQTFDLIKKNTQPSDFAKSLDTDMDLLNLQCINYPIQLITPKFNNANFFDPEVMLTYVFDHYSYKTSEDTCMVEKGDIVIDCGGDIGDSALLFSYLAGESGHVYSYEFMNKTLKIFEENLKLNPILAKTITIVPHAVYEKSYETVSIFAGGGGGTISDDTTNPHHNSTFDITTLSIDGLVKEKSLQKVDFIKMDIEGAELSALKGAMNTIKIFKPKLAISIYHKLEDLYEIPKFIHDLNLGYKFYFDQYSIFEGEKVMYAKVA